VSQAFARQGFTVCCNDIAVWSEVFATAYLLSKRPRSHYTSLIAHLNSVPPADGWFTEFYGGDANGGCSVQQDGLKKPWQKHNTKKVDGIRQEIESLSLTKDEKAVALTSLILAMDRVDSTLGHFVSYLRDWAPRSYRELQLSVPAIVATDADHRVLRGEALNVASTVEVDLAYFDPPYGSNNEKMPPSRVRYSSYYHVWTSVCLFDKPKLFGKARRREDSSDMVAPSVFEDYRKNPQGGFIAVDAIDRLLGATRARWIILSYSSGGRATARDLDDVIRRNGQLIEALEIDYKRNVMASMKWTNKWLRDAEQPNREFLFLIERSSARQTPAAASATTALAVNEQPRRADRTS
jgi:adenine-specific DNA-methyltransferase